jgi:hypothetical protein
MPDILIHCPITGRVVPTGLATETVIFETLPDIAIPLNCPRCGQTHFWNRRATKTNQRRRNSTNVTRWPSCEVRRGSEMVRLLVNTGRSRLMFKTALLTPLSALRGASHAKNSSCSCVCHLLVSEALWIHKRHHQDAAAGIVPYDRCQDGH